MWKWFAIGAVLGIVQLLFQLRSKPIDVIHPAAIFAVSALFGAVIYGTILWLVFDVIF
jgi:hypothetical protein